MRTVPLAIAASVGLIAVMTLTGCMPIIGFVHGSQQDQKTEIQIAKVKMELDLSNTSAAIDEYQLEHPRHVGAIPLTILRKDGMTLAKTTLGLHIYWGRSYCVQAHAARVPTEKTGDDIAGGDVIPGSCIAGVDYD